MKDETEGKRTEWLKEGRRLDGGMDGLWKNSEQTTQSDKRRNGAGQQEG